MLCDGDSKAFSHLQENPPYGPNVKTGRAECINHAPKRFGKACRNLTKDKSKKNLKLGGKGYGKLTGAKIKRLQNFYRSAIVEHKPDVKKMKNGIWASLYHCSSTDAKPNHSKCPKGKDSWCYYNKAKALKQTPPAHKVGCKDALLPHIAKELEPIYERMTEQGLLERLSVGATTNSNECLHGVIWKYCPKHLFFSRASVQAAAARAIAGFNGGARSLLNMMDTSGIQVTGKTLSFVDKTNAKRVKKAHKESQKVHQRKRLFTKKNKEAEAASQREAEGNPYEAGAY